MAAVADRPAFASRLTPSNLIALGLLVALGMWLLWNFVDSPSQFIQVSVIGLTNGAIYALIALGYTLVYGIIELINFAHGDLFMLGSVFGMHLLNQWLGVTDSSFSAWLVLVAVMVATMAFCGSINVAVERVAYRPSAPRAEAGAADHRDRHVASSCRTSGCSGTAPGQVGIRRVLPGGTAFEIGVGPHPVDLDHRRSPSRCRC